MQLSPELRDGVASGRIHAVAQAAAPAADRCKVGVAVATRTPEQRIGVDSVDDRSRSRASLRARHTSIGRRRESSNRLRGERAAHARTSIDDGSACVDTVEFARPPSRYRSHHISSDRPARMREVEQRMRQQDVQRTCDEPTRLRSRGRRAWRVVLRRSCRGDGDLVGE